MKRRIILLAAPALALVPTTPALGADATVRAVEPVNSTNYVWDEPAVTINAGEKVTWTFDGASAAHNVLAASTNWTYRSALGAPPQPPVSFTFATAGVYDYVCEVHSSTMIGRVTVNSETGAPPPPPPAPPLSQQAFRNDGTVSANAFEVGGLDTEDPALRRIAVRRTGAKARISFRVDEQSRVTVRLSRGGKRVKTKHANTAGRGSVTVRKLEAGRYKATIVARDLAGNASRTRTVSFTVS